MDAVPEDTIIVLIVNDAVSNLIGISYRIYLQLCKTWTISVCSYLVCLKWGSYLVCIDSYLKVGPHSYGLVTFSLSLPGASWKLDLSFYGLETSSSFLPTPLKIRSLILRIGNIFIVILFIEVFGEKVLGSIRHYLLPVGLIVRIIGILY